MRLTYLMIFMLILATPLQAQISSDSVLWFQPGEAGSWNGDAEEYFMYFCQTPPILELPGFPDHRCDFSGIWFDFTNEFTLDVTSWLLDAGADFYTVSGGDTFSRQAIINDQFDHLVEFNLGSPSYGFPTLLFEYENESDYFPVPVSTYREIGLPEYDIANIYFENGGTNIEAFIGMSVSTHSSGTIRNRSSYGWVQFRVLPNPDNPTGFQIEHLGVDRFVLEMVDHAIAFDSDGIIVGTRTALPVPEPSTAMMLGCISFACLSRRRAH